MFKGLIIFSNNYYLEKVNNNYIQNDYISLTKNDLDQAFKDKNNSHFAADFIYGYELNRFYAI